MEINNHICFTNEKNPRLLRYLTENSIEFKMNERFYGILDIFESNPHWNNIEDILSDEKALCIYDTRFSPEELRNADWMTVRSIWHNGYPQPESEFGYENITYTRENKCNSCGVGLRQVGHFRLKKTPNWGAKHFMMLNWIEDEFFISDHAKKILEKAGFVDISFLSVKNKNGKELLPNVFQLKIHSNISRGLVEGGRDLQEVLVCPECASVVYHPSGIGMHRFRKEVFDSAPDIVKTTDEFGWGKAASQLILINQKLYSFIVENNLERGLEFQPVELI